MKNVYVVILSGGSGTRLWPLSRKNRPKHLLPFINEKSLLESTIDRNSSICPRNKIGIITTQEQLSLIPKEINTKIGFTLKEPVGRNTGPAILYTCLEIEKKDKNSIAIFLPADHFIPNTNEYLSYLTKAIDYASNNNQLVTLGLMPTHPATGYGYIQASLQNVTAGEIYSVERFHEKPSREMAEKYLVQKDMFWNLGIFVGKTSSFIEEYKNHSQEAYSSVKNFCDTGSGYDLAPSISIDYAVMEKSKRISIIPCNFEWNDVGNLHTFLSIQQKFNKQPTAEIINIDCKNNIARTNKKIVSFIGLDNVCVVEDGDVLVIAKQEEVEKINKIRENAATKTLL